MLVPVAEKHQCEEKLGSAVNKNQLASVHHSQTLFTTSRCALVLHVPTVNAPILACQKIDPGRKKRHSELEAPKHHAC